MVEWNVRYSVVRVHDQCVEGYLSNLTPDAGNHIRIVFCVKRLKKKW